MKSILIVFFLVLLKVFVTFGQDNRTNSMIYYNQGVDSLNAKNYECADSLFTLALNFDRSPNTFFNRALARKKLENMEGFCYDIFMATAHEDSEARMLFLKLCTNTDTTFFDSNSVATSKELAFTTKVTAKRKYDSNKDIIVIDSQGNEVWSNEVDSALYELRDSPHLVVEQMPSFPGGEQSLIQFLSFNIKYPEKAKSNNVTGTVYIAFMISKNGMVKDIRIIRGVDDDIDREALRVIGGMPRWFPGIQDGRFVNVQYNLPIRFSLNDGKKIMTR